MNDLNLSEDPSLFTEEDNLDEQLNDYVNRGTLVGKVRTRSKERPKVDDMSLQAEIRKNGWLYVFLLVSAVFTATLGVMMGIAPYNNGSGIYYNTDAGHMALGLMYGVAFVTVTEFAFGLAKWLYFNREENNVAQKSSMLAMMIVSGISIVATGIAGGMVIASTIAFLTDFRAIPHQAQLWVIVAIPSLMFLYAIFGTIYILSSDEAAAKRIVRERRRETDLDHETRRELILQWGREQVQREQMKVFIRMVQAGKLSAGEAQAAIDARMTLGQLEEHLNRDLDGDNVVGTPPSRPTRSQSPFVDVNRAPSFSSETRDFTSRRGSSR